MHPDARGRECARDAATARARVRRAAAGRASMAQAQSYGLGKSTPSYLVLPMRLWRLTRTGQTALDGVGTSKHGGRYSPPGAAVVNFASEAGLAVLVALRYLPGDPAAAPDDYVLGWTEIDAIPQSVPDADGDDAIRAWVTCWLEERRRMLAAV